MYTSLDILPIKSAFSELKYDDADKYLLHRAKVLGFSTDFLSYKAKGGSNVLYPLLYRTLNYAFSLPYIDKNLYEKCKNSDNLTPMFKAISNNLHNEAVIKFVRRHIKKDNFIYRLYNCVPELNIERIALSVGISKQIQAMLYLACADTPLSVKSVRVMEILS